MLQVLSLPSGNFHLFVFYSKLSDPDLSCLESMKPRVSKVNYELIYLPKKTRCSRTTRGLLREPLLLPTDTRCLKVSDITSW